MRRFLLIFALLFPASAFATNPPTTNIAIWYRADSLTCTSSCSGTNNVTNWIDKSSNMNDAAVSAVSTSVAGKYLVSATNSQPGVTFSKTDHSGYDLGSVINLTSALTICGVTKLNSTNTKDSLVSGNAGSFNYYQVSAGKYQAADKTSQTAFGAGTASVDTSYHSWCVDYNGTTLHYFLDGNSDGTVTPSDALTANQSVIGFNKPAAIASAPDGEWYDGVLCDLVIYTSVLSAGDRTQWFTYTTERYNIPVATSAIVSRRSFGSRTGSRQPQ